MAPYCKSKQCNRLSQAQKRKCKIFLAKNPDKILIDYKLLLSIPKPKRKWIQTALIFP